MVSAGPTLAEDKAPAARPAIQMNRWAEDWSVLADPALRTEPLDSLKYIPLVPDDPESYVSFGATARERFESNNAPAFGTSGAQADAYLIQRLQLHADVHFDANWRFFTQIEDDRAYDKTDIGPVDRDPLDLRLAFLEYTRTFDAGTFKARVGRQDFAFDLQRFVASRDGPNVRQSFDAVWADWETGKWRFIGLVGRPVQYVAEDPFDDTSKDDFRFSMARVERQVLGTNELSAYYALFEKDDARFLDAAGDEQRSVLDIRFAGKSGALDWDVEAMGQFGSVGESDIAAWAIGSRSGYTFQDLTWSPRIGLQVDAASGDRDADDGDLGTFNPLFPNGYYFTLAGYTGYSNLIHVKPSVTVTPAENLTVMAAAGLQWRQTTEDAVYTQPTIPVAGTAGHGDSWTGAYGQFRADYKFNPNLTGAVEIVHFVVGDTVEEVGGRDSTYVGVELKASW